jgi:hypothetical protein
MPENYVLLERTELNDTTASVTFANIPQTGYTDLKIVVSARGTVGGAWNDVTAKFNSSTTGYTQRYVYGTGSAAASNTGGYSAGYAGHATGSGTTASTFGNFEVYIPNYTGSNNKSFSFDSVTENNATSALTMLGASLWSNTSAITSILLELPGGSFVSGSTFSLYGIAALGTTPAIAPKASGGNVIATDGTYWYHAFTSSGTFTPQVGLTADCLVIAGGGAGGVGNGGGGGGAGGGAGGYLSLTAQSLATQSYAVTVGAGGTAVSTSSSAIRGTQGSNSQIGALTAAVGGGGGGGADSGTTGSPATGGNGGSGGGGSQWNAVGTSISGGTNTSGQGFAGGNVVNLFGGSRTAAGGGGAGAVGGNADALTGVNGSGGAGSNANSTWATATSTGVSGFYAGGGGGSTVGGATSGGSGGGGGGITSTDSIQTGTSGTINTGSGGGGLGGSSGFLKTSGAGGSGIIIIRYPIA